MAFVKPIDRATPEDQIRGIQKFQPSSRILALKNNTSKSIGASCNVFSVEDNITSIMNGLSWAGQVGAYQGAPSLDFSKLRPAGSKLGTGGTASGAVSFMIPVDALLHIVRREEKKNSAGIVYLDYRHPELDNFLQTPFKSAYKGVYLPMHDTPEAEALLADEAMLTKLAKAYDEFRCFLVKRPLPVKAYEGVNYPTDTPLFINLCTEVEIPHKGFCILGAVNLSLFTLDNLHEMPSVFADAAKYMLEATIASQIAASDTPLSCDSPANKQFGLGVYGLASLLGNLGITYEEFADELDWALTWEDESAGIHDFVNLYNGIDRNDPAVTQVVGYLLQAYERATTISEGRVRAAFCIQPTVSTAQRSFDARGFHASPEIAPVQGLRHTDAVSTIVKSAIKGDNQIDYSPNTWTMEDVPYETYARVSALWQRLLDSTGLAHRHSHCFYGKQFTEADLRNFYTGELRHRKSLYYRLPHQVNVDAMDKSQLWQTVSEGELVDFDVNALLSGAQMPGNIECSCTM